MQSVSIYTPLKSIVAMVLDEVDKSIADFEKCWVLGLRGLTDMTFDVSGQTKTVRLPVPLNKTVPFPADILSWSKVGLLNEKGEINTLKVNNALTTFRDNNPNRLENLTPDINDGANIIPPYPYYANYYYAGNCYQLYGVGGGVVTYGDCKVDELNKVIILNLNFRYDAIMLEYISCPQMDEDYQVPTCLQEAIIMFIKWKLKLAKDYEYYAELTKGRRRLPKKKSILQSINQVIRESESMKLRS